MKGNKKGFTLIEILVVVMIIGVLASIAIPAYKRAVEKSKAAEALNTLGALVKAEQSYALLHDGFTTDFEDFDLDLSGGTIEDETLKLNDFDITITDGVGGLPKTAFIQANRRKGNNVIYSLYQCVDTANVFCIDADKNDVVTCDSLGLIEATKAMDPCDGVPNNAYGCGVLNGSWSTATGTCYDTPEERCSAVSGSFSNGECKFIDNNFSKPNQILDEGMGCYGNKTGSVKNDVNGTIYQPTANKYQSVVNASCWKPVINDGGTCYGNTSVACSESIINPGGLCQATTTGACYGVTINGGLCNSGSGSSRACYFAVVNEGGTCQGTSDQGCYGSTINKGGICRGGDVGNDACKNSFINSGGICIGKGLRSCREVVLNEGAIFVAHDSTSGMDAIYNGGCCISCNSDTSYCPSNRQCAVSQTEKERYCAM